MMNDHHDLYHIDAFASPFPSGLYAYLYHGLVLLRGGFAIPYRGPLPYLCIKAGKLAWLTRTRNLKTVFVFLLLIKLINISTIYIIKLMYDPFFFQSIKYSMMILF